VHFCFYSWTFDRCTTTGLKLVWHAQFIVRMPLIVDKSFLLEFYGVQVGAIAGSFLGVFVGTNSGLVKVKGSLTQMTCPLAFNADTCQE